MPKNLQVAWTELLQRIHSELKLKIQKKNPIFVGQKMHFLTVSIVQKHFFLLIQEWSKIYFCTKTKFKMQFLDLQKS